MNHAVINHAGAVLHLCSCCSADAGVATDQDLRGFVCQDCQTKLRYAQAHLKTQGIRGCAPDKEVQFREGQS